MSRLRVDRRAWVVEVDGQEVYLTNGQYRALLALIDAQGAVVAHHELVAAARDLPTLPPWQMQYRARTQDAAGVLVLALRTALGDAVNIVARRGIGYKLVDAQR